MHQLELLLAGLSCSYIVSSGMVKDFGRAMMEGGVAEWWREVPLIGSPIGSALGRVNEGWMPAITGLHFLPLFLLAVWMLNRLPRPSDSDVAARSERKTMTAADRLAFVRQFALGMASLCIAYFFLTAYRDFRDNYQVEIFDGLGYPYAKNKTIISKAETIVAFGVMVALKGTDTRFFEVFDDETDAVNSFFPDREIKRFDILSFVKQIRDE